MSRIALSQSFTSHNFRSKAVFGGYIRGFKCENEVKYASILLYSVKFSKLIYSYLVNPILLETWSQSCSALYQFIHSPSCSLYQLIHTEIRDKRKYMRRMEGKARSTKVYLISCWHAINDINYDVSFKSEANYLVENNWEIEWKWTSNR